jgi:hypothetical protein
MNKLLFLMGIVLLVACSDKNDDVDKVNLMSKFDNTWNIYESFERNEDGTITYNSQPWGGLVGTVKEQNMPVDWSNYESVTFEFAEPTNVPTQIMVTPSLKTWGKKGITSLTSYFDGQNVTSVSEVVLQTADSGRVVVSNVYLSPKDATWTPVNLWTGNCQCGDWQDGFIVAPEKFEDAYEGDKLEFVLSVDNADPSVTFWLLKTIYNGTDTALEGNSNELNDWGCVLISKGAAVYRMILTANDVVNLRQHGLFVNGHYVNITKCNLLQKEYLN